MNVSMRDSKQVIFDAYENAINQLNEKAANIINPTAELTKAKKSETIAVAETTIGLEILNPVIVERYETVMAAIKMQEKELEMLYGIQAEANSLAALINAHNAQEEAFTSMLEAKKIELEAQLHSLSLDIAQKRSDFEFEMKELKANLDKERKREQEDFEYNKKRARMLDLNSWEDEKSAREKAIAEKEEVLSTKEQSLDHRELVLDEMTAKIDAIPALLDETRTAALETGKKEASREFGFEKRAIESKFDSERAILNNKIEHLSESNDWLSSENAKLQEKLDAAYTKIQETAAKTVEAVGNAKTIASYESIIKDSKNNK